MISMTMFEPFCDYLNVTFSPEDNPVDAVKLFVQNLGCYLQSSEKAAVTRQLWRTPEQGILSIDLEKRYCRISASGTFLQYLRNCGVYVEYLSLLSVHPYTITRLDASCDYPEDAAPVVNKLARKYRKSINLTRKAISTRWVLSARFTDDVISGTFYAGKRGSGLLSVSVYDKQKEQWDKYKVETGPWLRYEISLYKAANCSLKDAFEPAPIFWHYASPKLLNPPPNVPIWHPTESDDLGWTHAMTPILPYQALKRRIENSRDLHAMIALADLCGPHGRDMLRRLVDQQCSSQKPVEDASVLTTIDREEDKAAASSTGT